MPVDNKRKVVLKYCDCDDPHGTFKCQEEIRAEKDRNFVKIFLGIFGLGVILICLFIILTVFRLAKLEYQVRNISQSVILMNDATKKFSDSHEFVTYKNPYYDFSDDEDENDDEEYDDQDDYLDYSAERPSNPEIVVDDEYEAVTNLTKDAKTGEGKSIVKRSVVSATKDGVLVNSESYAEIKAKNYTHKRHEYGNGKSVTATPARSSALGYPWPLHRSVYENTNPKLYQESLTQEQPATTKKPSVSMRRSRVMSREDPSKAFRKIVKKPLLKSGDVEYEYYPSGEIFTTPETTTADFGKHRKLGRARPLISIQFNGDTSKYVLGKHDNFNGNGHMRHAQRNFVDWVSSDWARKTGMDSHFSMTDGVVTVKESGIYFVYAQIYYLDEHDTTGFRVFKNNNMILQCTITQHSAIASMKGNTCYTAGVEFFSAGDTVFLSDITPGKYSLFEPGKSFFGLVKFGDFKNK